MLARPASIARIRYGEAAGMALIGGAIAGAFVLWASWHFGAAPREPLGVHLKGLVLHSLPIRTNFGAAYADWMARGGRALIVWRLWVASAAALAVASLIFVKTARPRDDYIHVSGRRLLTGAAAMAGVKRESDAECQVHGTGLKLHPSFSFALSLDREPRHIEVSGSIGSGKTQVFLPLMLGAHERDDRMIIHDTKGDFTAGLPGDVLIVAPWDQRSAIWDIAADCRTKQDARELAARLIQESKDPMWSLAARQVLTAILVSLQNERGTSWGWRDIADLIPLPQEELLELMQRHFPEGIRAVEEASKTTQSILLTFSSYMAVIFDLADAWGDAPERQPRISFSEWLADDLHPRRTIILQNSGRFLSLSRAYIGGIIALLSSRINSPDFSDSKTRRIWFFLDEFPQIGKLENFAPLLEVGRSKGVRVVLGAQDMAQIEDLYGREAARAWGSMIGTHIIARINPGETAEWVAQTLVGQRIVERLNVATSGAGDGVSTTRTYVRETVPVLMPSQLSTDLGSTKQGVKCLLLGYRNANILTWPYTSLQKLRPVSQLAAWVRARTAAEKTIRNKTQQHDEMAQPVESPAAPVAAALLAPQAEQPGEADTPALAQPEISESSVPGPEMPASAHQLIASLASADEPADESDPDHTQKNSTELLAHVDAQESESATESAIDALAQMVADEHTASATQTDEADAPAPKKKRRLVRRKADGERLWGGDASGGEEN